MTEPVNRSSRTSHTKPTWRFVGVDEEGERADWLEVVTSVAQTFDRLEEHGPCQVSVKIWIIHSPLSSSLDATNSRELLTRDTTHQRKTFGLSLSYPSQTKSSAQREAHQRLSKLFRAAGWIRFRPRHHERWLPLTSGRALITPMLISSARSGGRDSQPSSYRVQLRLPYRFGEDLGLGESDHDASSTGAPERILVRMLKLAQTHEMSPVPVNHVDVNAQWNDLTLELDRVDQHLIDWALHHPRVDILEVSLLPKIGQQQYTDAFLSTREPELWRHVEQPAGWPKPLRSLQDSDVHSDPKSPELTIASPFELTALPIYISNEIHLRLSTHAQSYDALIFEERFESTLKDILTCLPKRLVRRVGVSILEERRLDTRDHNDRSLKIGIGRQRSKLTDRYHDQPLQTQSVDERAAYILVRLTGLDHITAQEQRDLRSELPYDQSVDQLVMKTRHPMIYQSQGLAFTFPIDRRALSELIEEPHVSARTHQRRGRLIMMSRYFSLLWRHERSADAEISSSTRAHLIEVNPWREYRGDDLHLALSKSRRAHLRDWLDDASIVIPASISTQRDESSQDEPD